MQTTDLDIQEIRQQVERIVRSETFQRSEGLQRILRYISEKCLADERDHIKEYAIGMDVCGKGPDYDPRTDPSARIQVGRLRQKLIEYYAGEGACDEIIVALPKGNFKLTFERHVHIPPVLENSNPGEPVKSGDARWRRIAMALVITLVISIVWGGECYIMLHRAKQRISRESRWTPATETFWRPFVEGDRPLSIIADIPMFVGLQGCCFYRDLTGNSDWDQVIQTQNFKSLRKTLNNPDLFDGRWYTTVGEAKSLVLLASLLGQRITKIRFGKSNELSWQQMTENNVILLGTKNVRAMVSALPVKLEIVSESGGLRILHPGEGEPGFIPAPKLGDNGFIADGDELHAVISVLPGPQGKGFVAVFSGVQAPGGSVESLAANNTHTEGFTDRMGAGSLVSVEYATSPASLEEFVSRIRDKDDRVPPYFQVVLAVKFKGGVPVSSHYQLGRELRIEDTAVTKKIGH